MTYSDKREFAARVFAAVKDYSGCDDWGCEYREIVRLLAQAQLDALPTAKKAAEIDSRGSLSYAATCSKIDAAYALAVQLAPMVGVEVMK